MSKYWVDTKAMQPGLKHCLRRGVVLAGAAILTGLVSAVPSASATPAEEVAGTADATVKSVQAASNAAQSLPSAVPPATAPAPPPPPQVPIQQPAQTSKPTPSPTGSGADVPSAKRTVSTARDSVSVSSTGAETTKLATSAGENGGRTPAFQNRPDAGASKAAPVNSPSRAPPSIKPAEVAVLQRWFFHIWPAIPLGDGADRGEAARVLLGDLLRPAAAAIARLLPLAPAITAASGDSSLGDHPGTASAPKPALPDAPAAATERSLIYLVALVALLALLAFTIWREFRAVLRPWPH